MVNIAREDGIEDIISTSNKNISYIVERNVSKMAHDIRELFSSLFEADAGKGNSNRKKVNELNTYRKYWEAEIGQFRGTNHNLNPENPSKQSKQEIKRVLESLYSYCIALSQEKDPDIVTRNINYIVKRLHNSTRGLDMFDLMRRQGLYSEEEDVITLDWSQGVEIENMGKKVDFKGKIKIWKMKGENGEDKYEVFYV